MHVVIIHSVFGKEDVIRIVKNFFDMDTQMAEIAGVVVDLKDPSVRVVKLFESSFVVLIVKIVTGVHVLLTQVCVMELFVKEISDTDLLTDIDFIQVG